MKAQSAYQRVVSGTRLDTDVGARAADSNCYEDDDCRFGNVMRMLRAGCSQKKIIRRYPEYRPPEQREMLRVMQGIIDGTICEGRFLLNKTTQTEVGFALMAEIVAGQLNGESEQEIAERLGVRLERVQYYTRGR